jgi:hypothetical protein
MTNEERRHTPEPGSETARDRPFNPSDGPPPPAPPGPLGSINWTPLGPSVQAKSDATGNPPVSGRVTGIAVGPSGMRAYCGAVDGGVWFTENAGATWIPLLDNEVTTPVFPLESSAEAVACLDVHFGASAAMDTIVVATGDSGNVGIRYSSQGGMPLTWKLETSGFQLGAQITRILIDPDDLALVFMATTSGLYHRTGPNSWQAAPNPSSGGYSDIAIAGTGTTKRYYVAYPNGQIYVSPDFATWTLVPNGSAVTSSYRVVLAVSESTPSVVYALDDNAILRRLIAGTFQTITSVPKAALFPGNQGVGDIIVAVDPADPDTIYLGGSRTNGVEAALFKGKVDTTNKTFEFNQANASAPQNDATWIGLGVHADVHSFAFALNGVGTTHVSSNVWVGCDGGLWQSTSSGAKGTFVPHNAGLATLYLRQMAQRADLDAVVFGAGLDNGMFRLFGEQAAMQIRGGDGGGVAVDQNNGYRVMTCGNGLGIVRTVDGGYTWSNANFPPAGDANEASDVGGEGVALYTSPAGVAPAVACVGTNRVWLTNAWGDPNSWITLPGGANPYLQPAPQRYMIDALDGIFVYSIAVVSDTLVFAATNKAVYRFDRSGPSWTQTALAMTGIPGGTTIASIAVADPNVGSLFLTLGVFSGGGHDHVWLCASSGKNNPGLGFASIMSKAVLDSPVNAIVVDPANPQVVFVGSEVGVWKGTGSGMLWSWTPFSSGLPESSIVGNGLAIHANARLLRATTLGRGVWEIPLDAPAGSGLDYDIFLRVNYADSGRIVGSGRYPWVDGAPDPTAVGFKTYHWMSADIKVFRDTLGLPPPPPQPDYLDFAFPIGDYIDSQTHIETADASSSDRIFVEVHNRGLKPLPAGQVRVCLLITHVGAVLPPLPAGYAAGIQAGTTSWITAPWQFAGYQTTQGVLDVRTPQIVAFDNVDFSQLGFAVDEHVCAAAFITTLGNEDRLTAMTPSLDQLTMTDKHVAHRNLHLVAAGARPVPPPGEGWQQSSETFLIDFHNPGDRAVEADLVFDRTLFPGELAVTLPPLHVEATRGWDVIHHDRLDVAIRDHLAAFFTRLGGRLERIGEHLEEDAAVLGGYPTTHETHEQRRRRIETLDRTKVFIARAGAPAFRNVEIEPGRPITAAVTVRPPPQARPGDRFRFDIVQRHHGRIAGGSSYIVAVVRGI